MAAILGVLFVAALAKSSELSSKYLQTQSVILETLRHPYQPGVCIYKPEYLNIVNSFDFEKNAHSFSNVDAVKDFYNIYKKGLIPTTETFSIYNERHRNEAFALSNLFCSAEGKFNIIHFLPQRRISLLKKPFSYFIRRLEYFL